MPRLRDAIASNATKTVLVVVLLLLAHGLYRPPRRATLDATFTGDLPVALEAANDQKPSLTQITDTSVVESPAVLLGQVQSNWNSVTTSHYPVQPQSHRLRTPRPSPAAHATLAAGVVHASQSCTPLLYGDTDWASASHPYASLPPSAMLASSPIANPSPSHSPDANQSEQSVVSLSEPLTFVLQTPDTLTNAGVGPIPLTPLSGLIALSPSPAIQSPTPSPPWPSASMSSTAWPSPTRSLSPSITSSASPLPSTSPSETASSSPSASSSTSPIPSVWPSETASSSPSASSSASPIPSVWPSQSVSSSPSVSSSASPVPSTWPSESMSSSPTVTSSASPIPTTSSSPSVTSTTSPSVQPSQSATMSATASVTPSISTSVSTYPSASASESPDPSVSASISASPSNRPIFPSPSLSFADLCEGVGTRETDFKDAHFAHAVAGGPYVETDFKKELSAYVSLNGLGSHSHFTKGTEIGAIVKYKWTWVDHTNVEADANGLVLVVAATVRERFPVGNTDLKLQVWDQFCNTAVDYTTVTVNPATKEGAYCYYYDFGEWIPDHVPLPLSPALGRKAEHSLNVGDINFHDTAGFGRFAFNKNTFAVRCIFSIQLYEKSTLRYRLVHSGPVRLFSDTTLVGGSNSLEANQTTYTKPRVFGEGLHKWQVLYVRPKNLDGKLEFQYGTGGIIPASTVRHDAGSTLPVITRLSSSNGVEDELVWVVGSAFVNAPEVYFGSAEAETVESTPGSMLVRVPKGNGKVPVTVITEAGESNGLDFWYTKPISICQAVKFESDTIKTGTGKPLEVRDVTALTYGPDGRLYGGTQRSNVIALAIDRNLVMYKACWKKVQNWPRRWVLGVAFNPKSNKLKMYFSTSTFYWKKYRLLPDPEGWRNGKIQSVTLSGPTACFNDDVTDVVTGLPVTNHDHGVNFVTFTPDGKMLIGVGGFTNGGISVPNDNIGGAQSNPLSGAIVQCPPTGTHMRYSGDVNLANVSIVSGECTTYATGLRNSFGGSCHTNGNLYVTDNGPNAGFGDFSTDCEGGRTESKNLRDKLHLVQPGKCHGHPNFNRGLRGAEDECAFEDDDCVKPLLDTLQSPTTGIMEYRSNTFGGKAKGDLFLTKFSDVPGKRGRVSRIQLSESGQLKDDGVQKNFYSDSGLAAVEGPRGEIVMSRVYKSTFLVLKPVCSSTVLTHFIGVHPKMGPATGNHKVLVSGYNFGLSPTAWFGSKVCRDVRVIDNDSFTCVTPPGLRNQQVKVVVNGTTGYSLPTQGSDYWYW